MEKLDLFRKRYPQTDALYFIKPTLKNASKIVADFPEKDKFGFD